MENVLDMTEKTARQVMDPRTAIVFLSTDRSIEENLTIARESGHTRFPVCKGDLDQVIGMVHLKDLLWAVQAEELSPDFQEIRRDMLFLPDSITLDRALRAFQQERIHMAILVDEYGAAVGMLTLENVLEEMVGEIQDEFDEELPPIRRIRRGEFRVDAICPIDLFCRVFDLEIGETAASTVGGLVFDLCGHLPERGEIVPFGDDRFVVETVQGQRIGTLRFVTRRKARLPATASEPARSKEPSWPVKPTEKPE
jgi:CBS domain containing-hemolysin-like protein